ncbi:WxL domain-containing protein [Candidatus Enterococcus ikei]|uniref:WxL domain-containing protein n=1 Tax=Candidatus Enterococcus ikei TaxID=2815326 RepID=A0ABS3GX16_9ENTE|nr:WxL domain-containing protein [Enterococcus sp. DIV0869a]MBO0439815.1 WxL domain-containing protein [Enterococcus sp. DIV0869a]
MKKKMLASLLLSTMILSVGAQVASAEELTSSKTTGEVGFIHGDKPGTVKPEEGPKDGEELEEDKDDKGNIVPLPNNGGIYVTHLPNFNFGTKNKTSVKTVEYPAYTEERKLKTIKEDNLEKTDEKTDPAVFYMPHSVQVSDVSGNEKATWSLSVVQDAPFESGESDGVSRSKLSNARIRIFENTFTNTLRNSEALAAEITGVGLETEDAVFGKHSAIPLAGTTEGSLTVLKNNKPGFTNASTTSAVFSNGYDANNYNPEKTKETVAYNGVKLNVPASDQAKAKKYTTQLTWTLAVEPGTSEEAPSEE